MEVVISQFTWQLLTTKSTLLAGKLCQLQIVPVRSNTRQVLDHSRFALSDCLYIYIYIYPSFMIVFLYKLLNYRFSQKIKLLGDDKFIHVLDT